MTTLQQLEEWERHEARCWLRWLGPGSLEAEEVTPGTCTLCGASGIGEGHDAVPYRGRCCDECWREVVLPARSVWRSDRDWV